MHKYWVDNEHGTGVYPKCNCGLEEKYPNLTWHKTVPRYEDNEVVGYKELIVYYELGDKYPTHIEVE